MRTCMRISFFEDSKSTSSWSSFLRSFLFPKPLWNLVETGFSTMFHEVPICNKKTSGKPVDLIDGELSEWSMVQHSKSWSLSDSSVLKNLDFTGFFGYSQLNNFPCSPHQFSPFSEVPDDEINTERYRSGHNGTDSKSVEPQGSVGSNPTRSAMKPAM